MCSSALPCPGPALPCPALPCPALPCPALPCPALPCPALPCPALPCPALPCPQHLASAASPICSAKDRPNEFMWCLHIVCAWIQIDGLVDHFMQFQREQRMLPVVWHQALLCFVQRSVPINSHALQTGCVAWLLCNWIAASIVNFILPLNS